MYMGLKNTQIFENLGAPGINPLQILREVTEVL